MRNEASRDEDGIRDSCRIRATRAVRRAAAAWTSALNRNRVERGFSPLTPLLTFADYASNAPRATREGVMGAEGCRLKSTR